MTKINYFSLGGQDEKEKYSGILEIDDEIFILNTGIGSSINNQFGVRKVIPDLSYIVNNKNKVKGIFLGTPKYSNIGSLPFFLEILKNIPIYTTSIGKTIIEAWFLRRSKTEKISEKIKPNIQVVETVKDFMVSKARVCAFNISNNIPESVGWIFKNPEGSVVFIDEFVFDNNRESGFDSQIQVIPQQTRNNISLLIVGAQNVTQVKGYASPNYQTYGFLKKAIVNTSKRVIVACYDYDVSTVINLLKIAKIYGLKFVLYSNSFTKLFIQLVKQRLVDISGLQICRAEDLKPEDENVLIVITGNEDRLYYKMHKILAGEDQKMVFQDTDTFILATVTKPGLELTEARLLDEVSRRNINTYKLPKTIILKEAGSEDQKLLANILRPRYIVPVNGLYKEFVNCDKEIQAVLRANTVQILSNGQILSLQKGKRVRAHSVQVGEQYVDSAGVLDIGTSILIERQTMNVSGVIVVSALYDKSKHVFSQPQIQDYGIIADDHDKKEEIYKACAKIAKAEFLKALGMSKTLDAKHLKLQLKKLISRVYERQMQKKPLVLVIISQVSLQNKTAN